jgi:hypothetical protein
VLIPFVALALAACLFLVFNAPLVLAGLILFLLFPAWGSVLARPIHLTHQAISGKLRAVAEERERRGEHIFPEASQRSLAAAIADRDVGRIKAALAGAGDLHREFSVHLPYQVPYADEQTFLSFALQGADHSEACAQVVQLRLAAGADPNFPHASPLAKAMLAGTRVTEILLRAGADINAAVGSAGAPIWWSVLEHGERGSSDERMLRLLLDHGADTRKRLDRGKGPVEIAVESQLWPQKS